MVRLIVVAPAFFEFTNDRLGVSDTPHASSGGIAPISSAYLPLASGLRSVRRRACWVAIGNKKAPPTSGGRKSQHYLAAGLRTTRPGVSSHIVETTLAERFRSPLVCAVSRCSTTLRFGRPVSSSFSPAFRFARDLERFVFLHGRSCRWRIKGRRADQR